MTVRMLLNIGSAEELDAHPVRGASRETFVMEDLLFQRGAALNSRVRRRAFAADPGWLPE